MLFSTKLNICNHYIFNSTYAQYISHTELVFIEH